MILSNKKCSESKNENFSSDEVAILKKVGGVWNAMKYHEHTSSKWVIPKEKRRGVKDG